jgi:hypothetical protein
MPAFYACFEKLSLFRVQQLLVCKLLNRSSEIGSTIKTKEKKTEKERLATITGHRPGANNSCGGNCCKAAPVSRCWFS